MNYSDHRSHLFLTELIISLTLFVISAAVCVALLIHARSISLESTRLTQAVYLAQTAAEQWRAGEDSHKIDVETPAGFMVTFYDGAGPSLDIIVTYGEEQIYALRGVERLG